MATKDESSLYEPLDSSRHQLRLMIITSAPNSDTIRCSLHSFDLNEGVPEYVALSYEWGPEEDMQTIYVNNQEIKIRPNLRSFLEVIRQWDDSRPLWVDQICIDQRSTIERGHQVGIMEHIYRKAVQTLCWLGPDPHDGLAFSVINKMNNVMRGRELDHGNFLHFWIKHTSEIERLAFQAMARSTYWTRHWIIQEIILSTCPILVYGSNAVDFSRLLHLCIDGEFYGGIARGSAMTDIIDAADVFRRRDQYSLVISSVTTWMFVGYTVEKSLCLDPRDKVYGIQSLYPLELRMRVDYQKSAAIVYLEMVSIWFNHFQMTSLIDPEFTIGGRLLARGMRFSYHAIQMGLQQLHAEKHPSFDTEAKVQEFDYFLQEYVFERSP
jgi:hypothetical protein